MSLPDDSYLARQQANADREFALRERCADMAMLESESLIQHRKTMETTVGNHYAEWNQHRIWCEASSNRQELLLTKILAALETLVSRTG